MSLAVAEASRAPSNSTNAPAENALAANQSDQELSTISCDLNPCDGGVSAESERPGDERHSGEVGHESQAPIACRTPAYSSYTEYVRKLNDSRPFQYKELLECLTYGIESTIFPLTSDLPGPSWPEDLVALYSNSTKKAIRHIKSPPRENVRVRIIILELARKVQFSSKAIIDAIGATFDVDPAFLNAFVCFHRGNTYRSFDRQYLARRPLPQNRPFLRFHGYFVSQVMDQLNSSGAEVKTVLILSWAPQWKAEIQGTALEDRPSIYSTVDEPFSYSSSFPLMRDGCVMDKNSFIYMYSGYGQAYATWLSRLNQRQVEMYNLHPYEFIHPWIRYQMYDIVTDTYRLRDIFAHTELERFGETKQSIMGNDLTTHAATLKDSLADALELCNSIPKFSNVDNSISVSNVQELQKAIKEIIEDATRILRNITETQQMIIGAIAIEESRRSIKEAVSVKRLTQLAFVFIPLSYASSIFGMNIDEMTGSGSNVWVFVVTSLCLLIGAMIFWWMGSTLSEKWSKHIEGRESEKVGLLPRFRIIYSGIRTRNFIWMIRQGVLLGLLTNNSFGLKADSYDEAWVKFYGAWVRRDTTEHVSGSFESFV